MSYRLLTLSCQRHLSFSTSAKCFVAFHQKKKSHRECCLPKHVIVSEIERYPGWRGEKLCRWISADHWPVTHRPSCLSSTAPFNNRRVMFVIQTNREKRTLSFSPFCFFLSSLHTRSVTAARVSSQGTDSDCAHFVHQSQSSTQNAARLS